MKNPLSYATMIIVRSAQMANEMTTHVGGGTFVTWPSCPNTGLRFDVVINTLHPEEIINDPRIRDWFEQHVRPCLGPNGKLVNDYLNYSPTKPGTVFSTPQPETDDVP